MPSCVAYNCVNRSDGSPKVTLFSFPALDKKRMRQWVRNINRKNWTPSRHSRICAHHFTTECFLTGSARKKLNSTAVPTIFDNTSDNKTAKLRVTAIMGDLKAIIDSDVLKGAPLGETDDLVSFMFRKALEGSLPTPVKNKLEGEVG
ncbi:hypothetical protein DPEC_G00254580 [Dallia pectoralis]|uniref:Uncharacterized protein n=1 Tax=Dallia pectoralis TaxID=75939 RepID=A0ACC2FUA2_DALPE|nr:hypothetical protein DPEC_G00254580 [Dallia pectoralis]